VSEEVQIGNVSAEKGSGTLLRYAANGTVLSQQQLILAAGQVYGASTSASSGGVIEWRPASDVPRFLVTVRRNYTGPQQSQVVGADGIVGAVGTGRLLVAPIDKGGVVVVVNTAKTAVNVVLSFLDSQGRLQEEVRRTLKPKATLSRAGGEGTVRIQGGAPESVVAGVYLRGARGERVPAVEPVGVQLVSIIPGAERQWQRLIVVNTAERSRAVVVQIRERTGEVRQQAARIEAGARSVLPLTALSKEGTGGVVTVRAEGGVAAWLETAYLSGQRVTLSVKP
jgi:hypothetical protein